MSKEQQEILDEVYENYCKSYPNVEKTFQYEGSTIDVRKMTKEEFVNECKTDSEFSEKWGLKIEERELSDDERTEYKKKRDGISRTFASYTHQMLDGSNIPTKLITITYNGTKIESYE
jgi:hypothetical protein